MHMGVSHCLMALIFAKSILISLMLIINLKYFVLVI